jgi:hypothetical protein
MPRISMGSKINGSNGVVILGSKPTSSASSSGNGYSYSLLRGCDWDSSSPLREFIILNQYSFNLVWLYTQTNFGHIFWDFVIFLIRCYFSFCSYKRRSFSRPFVSRTFWVANTASSLFLLSYSSVTGSDSNFARSSAKFLNCCIIGVFRLFFRYALTLSPRVLSWFDLVSSDHHIFQIIMINITYLVTAIDFNFVEVILGKTEFTLGTVIHFNIEIIE